MSVLFVETRPRLASFKLRQERPAIRDRYAKPTGRYSPTHPGINYGVEAAPTAQGPFLPYQDLATPGANQMTLPASEFMRFLRLAPKP